MINARNGKCIACIHWTGFVQPDGTEATEGGSCLAFELIPPEILSGQFDHRYPWPKDNGIRFEPKPGISL